MWRSKTSKVKDNAVVLNYNSFTTQLTLKCDSASLVGKIVKITSSEWQYCAINGLVCSLDMGVPAEVPVDIQGNVTIISQADDIAPPILHIQSEQFAIPEPSLSINPFLGDLFHETLNIYPQGKVYTHLQSVTDGQSFEDATTQDGKFVLPRDTDPKLANGVASQINTLVGSAKTQFLPASQGRTFTAIESPAAL